MMQLSSLRREHILRQRVIRNYLKQHNVSPELSVLAKKHLEERYTDVRKEHEEKTVVLKALPTNLLMDLYQEVRVPLLLFNNFFYDLTEEHPRVVRRLCHDAMEEVPLVASDLVFSTGDACHRMVFIETGALTYTIGRTKLSSHHASNSYMQEGGGSSFTRTTAVPRTSIKGPDVFDLERGKWLSEPVLWTSWELLHTDDSCAANVDQGPRRL
eukprot:gnl/TRDRNA2_/TRDRNA2_141158_c1_seq1.p1 gnl/TRDRNA2_/TRDRNA2_141158_c1~~gnl/TRDRNA2_/TRDRNA2_141158_c1_seq1.p1  ORF type:complete len:213 (+),score=33.43 gnl/TRDRNA2_/TRDRNA2_141158_c1_seq1:2-640(+)